MGSFDFLPDAEQVRAPKSYDTTLSPGEESAFQAWKSKFAPSDSGADYDLRGAFKAGLTPDQKSGHWPDTFKKPNHPTFSNESIYAKDRPDLAGSWQGETYVPSAASASNSFNFLPDAPAPKAPPAPRKPQFAAPRTVGAEESFWTDFGRGGASTARTLAAVPGAAAVGLDKLVSALTGGEHTKAADAYFKFASPILDLPKKFDPAPNETRSLGGEIAGVAGGLSSGLAQMAAMPGSGLTAFPRAAREVVRAVPGTVVKGAPLIVPPAIDTGAKVAEAGGDLGDVAKVAATQAAATIPAVMLPLSAAGGAVKRTITGGGSGGIANLIQQALTNEALGEKFKDIQTPIMTGENLTTQLALPAAMALLFGPRGGAARPAPTPPPRPEPELEPKVEREPPPPPPGPGNVPVGPLGTDPAAAIRSIASRLFATGPDAPLAANLKLVDQEPRRAKTSELGEPREPEEPRPVSTLPERKTPDVSEQLPPVAPDLETEGGGRRVARTPEEIAGAYKDASERTHQQEIDALKKRAAQARARGDNAEWVELNSRLDKLEREGPPTPESISTAFDIAYRQRGEDNTTGSTLRPLDTESLQTIEQNLGIPRENVLAQGPQSQRKLLARALEAKERNEGRAKAGPLAATDIKAQDAEAGPASPRSRPNVPGDRTPTSEGGAGPDARTFDQQEAARGTSPEKIRQAAARKKPLLDRIDQLHEQRERLDGNETVNQLRRRRDIGERLSERESAHLNAVEQQIRNLDKTIYNTRAEIYGIERESEAGSQAASGTSDRPFRPADTGPDVGPPTQEQGQQRGFRAEAEAKARAEQEAAIDRLEAEWRERSRMRGERAEREESRRRRGEGPAGERYRDAPRSANATKGPDGNFAVDPDGYVMSDQGSPIWFDHQRKAGRWILSVGNKQAPGKVYQIANHPSGQGFTVQVTGDSTPPPGGGGRRGGGDEGGGGPRAQEEPKQPRPGGGETPQLEGRGADPKILERRAQSYYRASDEAFRNGDKERGHELADKADDLTRQADAAREAQKSRPAPEPEPPAAKRAEAEDSLDFTEPPAAPRKEPAAPEATARASAEAPPLPRSETIGGRLNYDAVKPIDPSKPIPDPTNDVPLHPHEPGNTIICMSCSDVKGKGNKELFDLYEGPMWQTLRSHLGAIGRNFVNVVSAKWGITKATQMSTPYNERLSKERADDMIRHGLIERHPIRGLPKKGGPRVDHNSAPIVGILSSLTTDVSKAETTWRGKPPIKNVIISGGENYRRVMHALVTQMKQLGILADDVAIRTTTGGIGEQRGQLGQWLREINKGKAAPAEAGRAAAPETSRTFTVDDAIERGRKQRGEPQPNEHGVYNKRDAEEFKFPASKADKASASIHVLETADGWISAVSTDHRQGDYQGHGQPLSGEGFASRDEAIAHAAGQIASEQRGIASPRAHGSRTDAQRAAAAKIATWAEDLVAKHGVKRAADVPGGKPTLDIARDAAQRALREKQSLPVFELHDAIVAAVRGANLKISDAQARTLVQQLVREGAIADANDGFYELPRGKEAPAARAAEEKPTLIDVARGVAEREIARWKRAGSGEMPRHELGRAIKMTAEDGRLKQRISDAQAEKVIDQLVAEGAIVDVGKGRYKLKAAEAEAKPAGGQAKVEPLPEGATIGSGPQSDLFPSKVEAARRAIDEGRGVPATLKDGTTIHMVNFDDGSGTRQIMALDANGKLVGRLSYETVEMEDGRRYNPSVHTEEKWRRKGVASAMYDLAEETGGKLPPASDATQNRTPEGTAFRAARAARRGSPEAPAPAAPRAEKLERAPSREQVRDLRSQLKDAHPEAKADVGLNVDGRLSVADIEVSRGDAAMKTITDWLDKHGFESGVMAVETDTASLKEAVKFFQKHGYEVDREQHVEDGRMMFREPRPQEQASEGTLHARTENADARPGGQTPQRAKGEGGPAPERPADERAEAEPTAGDAGRDAGAGRDVVADRERLEGELVDVERKLGALGRGKKYVDPEERAELEARRDEILEDISTLDDAPEAAAAPASGKLSPEDRARLQDELADVEYKLDAFLAKDKASNADLKKASALNERRDAILEQLKGEGEGKLSPEERARIQKEIDDLEARIERAGSHDRLELDQRRNDLLDQLEGVTREGPDWYSPSDGQLKHQRDLKNKDWSGWKALGENRDGTQIYEDRRGRRRVQDGEWVVTEHPGANAKPGNRIAEFKTDSERGQFKPGGKGPGSTLGAGPPLDEMLKWLKRGIERAAGPASEWKESIQSLTSMAKAVRDAFTNRRTEGESQLGNLARWFSYDTHSHIKSFGKALNSPTIQKIADMIYPTAGKASEGMAFHEQRQAHIEQQQKVLEPIVTETDRLEGQGVTQEQLIKLVENPSARGNNNASRVAEKIAAWLKGEKTYQRGGGVDAGERENYYPHEYDRSKIVPQRAAFIADATRAYEMQNPEFSHDEAAQAASQFWYRRTYGADGTPGSDLSGTGTPLFVKHREFTGEAARIMDKWRTKTVGETLQAYLHRSSRLTETQRRFGYSRAELDAMEENGKSIEKRQGAWGKWGDLEDEIRKEAPGITPDELKQLRGMVASSMGFRPPTASVAVHNASQWLRVWTALSTMGHSAMSSVGETISPIMRANGDIKVAATQLHNITVANAKSLLSQAMGEGRSKHMQRLFDYGEDLGILVDSAMAAPMRDRWLGDDITNRFLSHIAGKFYRLNLLDQLTNWQRALGIDAARVFLRRSAQYSLDGNKAYTFYLRELGVPEAKVKQFAEYVKALGDELPDPSQLHGDMGQIYRGAMVRFSDQSIQRPNAATRPQWANSELGAVAFQLQSFAYAYTKNALLRQKNLMVEAFKGASWKEPFKGDYNGIERLQLAGGMIPGMILMSAVAGMVWELRDQLPTLFGAEEGQRTWQAKVQRAMSAGGMFGAVDPLIQAFTGLRYNRPFASQIGGPVYGAISTILESMSKTLIDNSEKTNAAERKAWDAVYQYGVQPAVTGLMASTPAPARLVTQAATLAIPAARKGFVDKVAGPRQKPSEPIRGIFEGKAPPTFQERLDREHRSSSFQRRLEEERRNR